MLSDELELILNYKKNRDNTTAKKIYQQNLPLVKKIAAGKDFCCRQNYSEDLIQHGMIGLFRAVDKFDEEKASGWKTYKSLWIRKEMQMFVTRFCDYKVGTTIMFEDYMSGQCEQAPLFSVDEICRSLNSKESSALLSEMEGGKITNNRQKERARKKIKELILK